MHRDLLGGAGVEMACETKRGKKLLATYEPRFIFT